MKKLIIFLIISLALTGVGCKKPNLKNNLILGGLGTIAFDAISNGTEQGTCTNSASFNWSHTTTGTNRFLAVIVVIVTSAQTGGTNSADVTYNSVAMTQSVNVVGNSDFFTSIYTLPNPTVGANTVNVSYTTKTGGDVAKCRLNAYALSYTGVNQTSPVEATASDTTLTTSITTLTNGAWVLDGYSNGTNVAYTANSGQTERFNHHEATGTNHTWLGGDIAVPTAGSQAMNWITDPGTGKHALIAFKPVNLPNPTPPQPPTLPTLMMGF